VKVCDILKYNKYANFNNIALYFQQSIYLLYVFIVVMGIK